MDRWFAGVARKRLESSFQSIRIHGLGALRAVQQRPVLLISNHTSWWDPLVAIWLTRLSVPFDSYAMMNADNLRRLPFFRRVGAFGVDLDDPSDGGAAVRYSTRLLREPGRLVWIFAQGDERPSTERPLVFKDGAAAIAKLARGVAILPLALRYELGGSARPDLYLRIGPTLDAPTNVKDGTKMLQDAVTTLLDEIDSTLANPNADRDADWTYERKTRVGERMAEWALGVIARGDTPLPKKHGERGEQRDKGR